MIEAADAGTDAVYAKASFTLAAVQSMEVMRANARATGLTLTGNELANNINGAEGDDVLSGGGAGDRLDGGAGADSLIGLGSGDILAGGGGRDQLTGGGGADRFVFGAGDTGRTPSTAERVLDFSIGLDRIDLSALDAITGGSDNAFSFIGTDSFSRTAGELRMTVVSGWTRVMGDTDGDGNTDFMVLLQGVHSLTASDFVL